MGNTTVARNNINMVASPRGPSAANTSLNSTIVDPMIVTW